MTVHKLSAIGLLSSSLFFFSGCTDQEATPGESDPVQDAMDATVDAANALGNAVEVAAGDAADAVEEALEEASDAVEETVENVINEGAAVLKDVAESVEEAVTPEETE